MIAKARHRHLLRVTLLEHRRQASWVHMNDVANTPLSSSLMTGYSAAALEAQGHRVEVVEGNLGRLSSSQIVARAAAWEPDLVGVHLVYDWSDGAHLRRFIADLRAVVGSTPIVLYGFYPTFAHADLLTAMPEVAAVILGEPETAWVELAAVAAAAPDASHPVGLAAVSGLAVRSGGTPTRTAVRPLIRDLDALPFPRRTPEMLALREVNVAGSRGCYGACSFCTINPFYGPGSGWRPRTPENVVAEMAQLLEAHPDKDRFYFVDPNFFGPGPRGRRRVLRLARLIGAHFDVRFGVEGRVNDIEEEVIGALVRAGFDEILIGLESGSDATLRRLNKGTSVAQNRRALRILRDHGIEPNVGFIMFEPESSLDDVRRNLAFLEEENLLGRLSVTANVLCHQQILLASTPAFRSARVSGRLQVSPHNPYEGSVPYRHPEVAFLAETVAEACRHLFAGLPRHLWGDGCGPDHPACAGLNGRLVRLFRKLLDGLVSGAVQPGPEVAAAAVAEVLEWLEDLEIHPAA